MSIELHPSKPFNPVVVFVAAMVEVVVVVVMAVGVTVL